MSEESINATCWHTPQYKILKTARPTDGGQNIDCICYYNLGPEIIPLHDLHYCLPEFVKICFHFTFFL